VIVDARAGKIYIPPDDISFSLDVPMYRLNSTLLVTEKEASMKGPLEVDLYNWDGSRLLLLKRLHPRY